MQGAERWARGRILRRSFEMTGRSFILKRLALEAAVYASAGPGAWSSARRHCSTGFHMARFLRSSSSRHVSETIMNDAHITSPWFVNLFAAVVLGVVAFIAATVLVLATS